MTKPSKKKSVQTKQVKWNTVSIYHVLSRNDYTDAEKHATWFTADEFAKIRNAAMALAKSVDVLRTAQQKSDLRGLERVMKANLKKHTARRQALFDEIACLRKKSMHPSDLATLFQSYTRNSQLEARGMGKDDEKRARDCYSEDDEFMTLFFDLYGGNALVSKQAAGVGSVDAANQPRSSIGKKIKVKKELRNAIVTTTTAVGDKTSKGLEQKQRFRDGISQRLVTPRSLR